MDFTILAVVLLIGVGIPVGISSSANIGRKKRNRIKTGMKSDGYGESRAYPLSDLWE